MDALIARALHKRREDRFPDAATMRTALTAAPHAAPAPAPTPTPTALDPAAAGPALAVAPARLAQPTPDAASAPAVDSAPAAAPPVPAGSAPSPRPIRRRPAGVVFRPTAEGAVALLGCLLCLVISRTDMIEVGQFSRVALLAAVTGSVLLLWSARLACAVAWGPVAEAVAVWSELARANIGWETHFVIIALVLGVVSALCLAAGYKDEHTGGFALIAFWFTSLAAVWFFLDDLRKIGVFYVLLLAVTLAIAAQVLKTRTRPTPPEGTDAAGPPGAEKPRGAVPADVPAAAASGGRGRRRAG